MCHGGITQIKNSRYRNFKQQGKEKCLYHIQELKIGNQQHLNMQQAKVILSSS